MLKSVLFLLSLLLVSSSAGCSMVPLKARVDLLEKELNDQRLSSQRLEQRLDEMQIQVALVRRSLNNIDKNTMVPSRTDLPKLGNVKVPAGDKAQISGQYRLSRPKRQSYKLHQVKIKAVDPSTVTERLSVDKDAAKRSLDGPSIRLVEQGARSGHVAQRAQRDRQDGDSIALKAFNEAFSLYRKNQFAKAADALEEFTRRFSEHEMASTGLYYAGKSRMMIGQFKEAASTFIRLVRLYPREENDANALLLAGRCQERLGKSGDARGTYLELVDAFPLSQEAITANKRLESIR